jgi:hypothetical protein
MGKWLLRDRVLIFLIILTLLIKLFSLFPEWVERYYSQGFFVYSSRFLRAIFGWIPFSVGDILYLLAGIFLVIKVWKLVRLLVKRRWRETVDRSRIVKYLKIALGVYIAFNVCWGLNYDRQGIASQLGITPGKYSDSELICLAEIVHLRLNQYAALVDSMEREKMENHQVLFKKGVSSYANAARINPFLNYSHPSEKASVFSHLGHYFGFTGYINPFTNEAHVKTTLPVFRQPFILHHEIAHQLGYAKEDEASFVGFLASKASDDIDVKYSMYYDLFGAVTYELLMRKQFMQWVQFRVDVHPRVRSDRIALINFYRGKENKIEPFMSNFYDRYLKINNQPGGKKTYNYVVALLIAYMNKHGYDSI